MNIGNMQFASNIWWQLYIFYYIYILYKHTHPQRDRGIIFILIHLYRHWIQVVIVGEPIGCEFYWVVIEVSKWPDKQTNKQPRRSHGMSVKEGQHREYKMLADSLEVQDAR